MRNMKAEFFDPYFEMTGMVVDPTCKEFGPAGETYVAPGDVHGGKYWVYGQENMFAIGIFNITLNKNAYVLYTQPEHLALVYYDDVDGVVLPTGKQMVPGFVASHAAKDQEEYRALHRQGSSIVGTSISLSPDYYRDYIKEHYGDGFNIEKAVKRVDECTSFPEMVLLFRQIRNYKKGGLAARLFYESKVAEAISLVIEKSRELEENERMPPLAPDTDLALAAVREYIYEHLDTKLTIESLAKIACMGETKFKECFRLKYDMPVGVFITTMRINKAQSLLGDTRLSIASVAKQVGYKKPGNFSDAFRNTTGLLPGEWREAIVGRRTLNNMEETWQSN